MTKKVVIPQSDLDTIEQARLDLYKMFEEECKDISFLVQLQQVTDKLYQVANRRYPEPQHD